MKEEFEKIIEKNLVKWGRLNKQLATERLAKEMIRRRTKPLKIPS